MKQTCSKWGQEIKKFSQEDELTTEELITRLAGKSNFYGELLRYWLEEASEI